MEQYMHVFLFLVLINRSGDFSF